LPPILFVFPPASSVILHKAKKPTADARRCTPIDPETAASIPSVAAVGRRFSSDGPTSRRAFVSRPLSAWIGVHRRFLNDLGDFQIHRILLLPPSGSSCDLVKKGTRIPKTNKRLWLTACAATLS
jgi:hypothetical protein